MRPSGLHEGTYGSCQALHWHETPSPPPQGCSPLALLPDCTPTWEWPDWSGTPCTWMYWNSFHFLTLTFPSLTRSSGWHPLLSLYQTYHSNNHQSITNLALDAFNPTVWIHWYRFWRALLPRGATNYPPPPTHGALDPNPMAVIVRPISHLLNSPPLKSICLQLTDKDIMWGHVKGLAQVHVDGITYSSFAQWCCHFPIEVHQMRQTQSALGEAMLAVSNQLFKQCVLIWLPGKSVPWYPPT